MGQKQKTEKKKEKKEERESLRKLVITMAKLSMTHTSTHGARKPPGPKSRVNRMQHLGFRGYMQKRRKLALVTPKSQKVHPIEHFETE